MSLLVTTILVIVILVVLISTVKFFRIILIVVFGALYMGINFIYMKVQKWHFGMKKKDPVVYYAFTPIYWLLVGITYLISAPYEFIQSFGIH